MLCVGCKHYLREFLSADLVTTWPHVCSLRVDACCHTSLVTGEVYLAEHDAAVARCIFRRSGLGECSDFVALPLVTRMAKKLGFWSRLGGKKE